MRHSVGFRWKRGLWATLFVLTLTGAAGAQSDEQRAAARSLATEGAAAFSEGRFKDAVDLFTRAEALVHAPTHLLYQARAYAKLGKFVHAREKYLRIVKEQLAANAPPQFRDAQSAAQEELKTVEPRIAKLTIQVAGAQEAHDLVVNVDGKPMPSVLVGVPQPLDPGEHRVDAIATGKRAEAQSITLRDGERSSLTLQLVADPSAVSPAATATSAAPATASATPPAATPGLTSSPAGPGPTPADTAEHTSSGSSGLRIGSYVAFGVGAIGVGAGTVFALRSAAKRSDANAICASGPGGKCPLEREGEINSLDSEANDARTTAIVGFAVGGVGVVTGVILLIASGNHSEAETASVVPLVGPRFIGLSGRF